MEKKLVALAGVLLAGIAVVGYVLLSGTKPTTTPPVAAVPETPIVVEPTVAVSSTTIGTSVEGRRITAYAFGAGPHALLFVGGIHGGYEWNGTLLAYQMIDHLTRNLDEIPNHLTIHIIPDLNPDGTYATLGTAGEFTIEQVSDRTTRDATGRFNANGVDLNRNFDCKWASESSWRGQTVSAGTGPFSEPEAAALRDYVTAITPVAVAFWHSQANAVYASECEAGVLPGTLALMNAYATAGNYGAIASFDAYPVTGDAEGWLASIGIPAVTVELETFNDTEWERNWAGMQAWFEYFAESSLLLE